MKVSHGGTIAFVIVSGLPEERRIPTARRSSSASAPVKLATVIAIRSDCS
jgi:hypothetical protein